MGKQVNTRRIANVTQLPEEAREVLAAAFQKKHLVPVEGFEA
ncbi:protein of unknown function [Candidatus Methylacidiphilum fumarolicum]|uniref:Uncharacterized protein n=1 Tax=Candidatus Methylacidiphilum fumarolicum TaxID=591154 RepID=A0ABN8XHN3_9BACT|nr:protein of unknown function [Candidatus Methylacidiphilum fumarolicum]